LIVSIYASYTGYYLYKWLWGIWLKKKFSRKELALEISEGIDMPIMESMSKIKKIDSLSIDLRDEKKWKFLKKNMAGKKS
jgi:hypothetical protein